MKKNILIEQIDIFWRSFYSPEFYQDLYRNRKSSGLLQVIIFAVLLWIASAFLFSKKIDYLIDIINNQELLQSVEEENGKSTNLSSIIAEIVTQMPVITINDGIASIDEEQPFFISDPNSGWIYLMIDTRDDVKDIPEEVLLGVITKSKIMVRKGGGTSTANYKDAFKDENIVVNKDFILDIIAQSKNLFWSINLLVIYIFIISALALVISAIIFALLKKTALGAYRVAVAILIPSICFGLIATSYFPPLIAIVIFAVIYGFFAVKAIGK